MTIVRRLSRYVLSSYGGRVIDRDSLKDIIRKFKSDPTNTINFLIHYGYLIRILRGLYYVKTVEEFEFRRSVDTLKLIALGMNKLKLSWYFGLYTALRLNGLTHEFHPTIFVLNDRIFRAKEIKINGEPVKFMKLKRELLFGTIKKDEIVFSDPEKTILDFIYVFRYRSVPEERIISFIQEYAEKLERTKVLRYVGAYPKSVEKVLEHAGII